ncbi:VOC family protein [Paenibacillus sedimenti]|uniref:VOC family protein n=1 Tax=Paenibacillus sedimenti TaxID=2770274 RepID=A0A926QK03_9BACL|nr:VOC family protein [Paenibacillus sedimenti]MBD0382286.1 VOC family protein [Paenibacillus sedimenti]
MTAEKLKIKRIDTVFVPVSDVKRSEEWYMRMFPFRVVFRSEQGDYVGFRFDEEGPLQAGLTIYQSDERPSSKHIPFNFYTSDVDASHSFFKKERAEVSEIHGGSGMRFFDVWDPDGNAIGVVTFPEPGSK